MIPYYNFKGEQMSKQDEIDLLFAHMYAEIPDFLAGLPKETFLKNINGTYISTEILISLDVMIQDLQKEFLAHGEYGLPYATYLHTFRIWLEGLYDYASLLDRPVVDKVD